MKLKIVIMCLFVSIFCRSQTLDEYLSPKDVTRNIGIKMITEKTFAKWETISFFNREGFLVQKINYYKNELRSEYRYEYTISDDITEGSKEHVYEDVFVWSDTEMNKFHIRYSTFDEYGNWTRSYFITEKGKKLRSKREKFNQRQKRIRDIEWEAIKNTLEKFNGNFLDIGAGTGYSMYKA